MFTNGKLMNQYILYNDIIFEYIIQKYMNHS